jgi:putative ABC transport system permease protein
MLLNYLKITLKVLNRNKFFSFVSLFGIVFTLVILLVATAFLDHLIAPHYPDVNRDRSLYVSKVRTIDSENSAQRSGMLGYRFLQDYVMKMKTPQQVGIASIPSYANAYAGSRRLKLNLKYTDGTFWNITAFDFLEGKAFNNQHIDNGDYVAVINEKTRDDYFGPGVDAVGQSIVVENTSYRVIGVVRDVPITRPLMSADVYLPYHVNRGSTTSPSWNGMFIAILLGESKADLPAMAAEYEAIVGKIPLPATVDGFTFDRLESSAETYLESFLRIGFNQDNVSSLFYTAVGIFMLLFMLLPAINLVNLNVSRIMERSSEIGVRKAFGASSGRLVGQFLIENIFITLLGGAIAIALTGVLIRLFNDSGLIPGADLIINGQVLLIGLGACLVFGLLSGVIPAYRMSRLHVVDALRGGEQ